MFEEVGLIQAAPIIGSDVYLCTFPDPRTSTECAWATNQVAAILRNEGRPR